MSARFRRSRRRRTGFRRRGARSATIRLWIAGCRYGSPRGRRARCRLGAELRVEHQRPGRRTGVAHGRLPSGEPRAGASSDRSAGRGRTAGSAGRRTAVLLASPGDDAGRRRGELAQRRAVSDLGRPLHDALQPARPAGRRSWPRGRTWECRSSSGIGSWGCRPAGRSNRLRRRPRRTGSRVCSGRCSAARGSRVSTRCRPGIGPRWQP